jgi:hypothetical protein
MLMGYSSAIDVYISHDLIVHDIHGEPEPDFKRLR